MLVPVDGGPDVQQLAERRPIGIALAQFVAVGLREGAADPLTDRDVALSGED